MQMVIESPVVTGEYFDSSKHLDQPDQLRRDLDERGYVFVRGLIPTDAIFQVRQEILEICNQHHWLKPDCPLIEGRINPEVGPFVESIHQEYSAVYDQLQLLESFHTLPHSPGLVRLFRDLFDEEPLVHPRHIARLIYPKATQETTPPHQDYIHIRGSKNTLTAWFPLGDCPMELGNLICLEGSHKLGLLDTVAAHGAGGRGIETQTLQGNWVGTDFRAGDVVVFLALTVHAGLPNLTEDQLRLSVDARTSPVSEPVHSTSLAPHMGRVTWDQVYAGWKKKDYQRYWEKLPLKIEDTPVSGY